MLPPIPILSDYGISPARGFLPEVLPLTRLPDPYYNKWEAVASNLQALILTKRLRGVVDRLPVLSTAGLVEEREWRRAYSLLIFMAHGYIWSGDCPSDRLPPPISAPLLAVSDRLEVPPVATYAGLCLWNFKPLFTGEAIDKLENLATLNTFTGSLDESWFYLISVAIEARGAGTIPLMLRAIDAARRGQRRVVAECLRKFAERLQDLASLLDRMHENCDPTVFYHRIRPFLAGSKNMAEAGLPHGVIYDDGSGKGDVYRTYSGGSNAQSSIIQFFDIVLGIQHRPTGEKKHPDLDPGSVPAAKPYSPEQRGRTRGLDRGQGLPPPSTNNFITEMRRYMPGPHARFLRDVAAVANIRQFVVDRGPDDAELHVAYDGCLSALASLRNNHIKIVTRYIVAPSREVRARSRSRSPEAVRQRLNLATASRQPPAEPRSQSRSQQQAARRVAGPQGIALDTRGNVLKGTGGTALMAFLKQARDETAEPAVEEWARRFIATRARPAEGSGDFFLGKDEGDDGGGSQRSSASITETVEMKGLAGTWTVEDEIGGICHY